MFVLKNSPQVGLKVLFVLELFVEIYEDLLVSAFGEPAEPLRGTLFPSSAQRTNLPSE